MLLFKRYEYNPQTDAAGRGESSRVYQATDNSNSNKVAVKIYKINDSTVHYSGIKNAQTILTLQHPALCSYFDIQEIEKEDSFGEKERLQVCVSTFMDAGNLVDWYNTHHDPALLQAALLNILNGLSYLHKKNIIHGYIKPSNILVTKTAEQFTACITDFAMGSGIAGTSSGILPQQLSGSASYFSPEQLYPQAYANGGKISFNTDIWSLAVIIYEILTGKVLFETPGLDENGSMANRLQNFELPETINTLPQPFCSFLKRSLVKVARERVQTAEELLPLFSDEQPAGNVLQLEQKPGKPEPAALVPAYAIAETENPDDTRVIALPEKDATLKKLLPVADENNDDTKIISRPAKTQAGNGPVKNNTGTDGTRNVANPVEASGKDNSAIEEVKSSEDDDTKIIAKPANIAPAVIRVIADEEEDATKIIAKPVVGIPVSKIPEENAVTAGDDTKMIGKPGNTEAPSGTGAENEVNDNTKLIKPAVIIQADASVEEAPQVDQTIIIAKINKDATGGSNIAKEEKKSPGILIRRSEKPVILFNRYEYFPASDLIGKGGFSRVYKAYDKKLSRWVALKVYKTGEFSDRYSPIAEIKRVVNLDHSNICRYLDIEEIENENPFGENEKIQVCVMELLDSGNFAEYYKANKDPEILKKLIQDVLNGLSYLHKNGIIHRDIKPGNILIKQTIEGPVAKITDFGISKNSDAENNSSSALIVSIPYMAPEQLNAKRYGMNEKISFNLDLWSLGVTIYEVFTGKVLFKNSDQDNSEQIMANIMAPDLPEKLNDLPEPFKAVVSHCVIKSARERASRAEELMVLLNTVSKPADTTTIMASEAANTLSGIDKEVLTSPQEEKHTAIIAPPIITDEKTTKSRFSIADEEKPVAVKEEKKKDSLLIFIGAAVMIFILFIIYLKACNQAPPAANRNTIIKTDTAHKAVVLPVVADTARKDTSLTHAKADTGTKHTDAVKPTHSIEKKRENPAEESHKKNPVAADGNTAAKYVLILSAPQTCTLQINSIDYGELQTGKPLKIYLTVGKYNLLFTSSSNSASTFTANIEVKADLLGRVDKFKIPLK